MKIGYTTENPTKEYHKAIEGTRNIAELVSAIRAYKEVAPDALKKAKQMTAADFKSFKKDLPKFRNTKGKEAEELNQKWGIIVLPRKLLLSSLMEIEFHVPWGCAFIRGEELGLYDNVIIFNPPMI